MLVFTLILLSPFPAVSALGYNPPTPWLYQLDIYRVESYEDELPDGNLDNWVATDNFATNSASQGSLPPSYDSHTASNHHGRNYISVHVRKMGYTSSNLVITLNGKSPYRYYITHTYTSGTTGIGDDIVYYFDNIDETESSGHIELTNIFTSTTTGMVTITRDVYLTFEPNTISAPANVSF
jgi:hypothetical protein